jgi:TPR repeat protein
MTQLALRDLSYRGNLSPCPRKSRTLGRESAVKKNKAGIAIVGVMAALLSAKAPESQTATQTPSREQCSLAAVSHLVAAGTSVCDATVVRRLARGGHAFEQNQMGIASVLAIGPDYSQEDALSWFEKAAQRGYPPAEVNLAVMYINGWGTPANYGKALHWLLAAAGQGFARAYFNLGILYLDGKGVSKDLSEAFRWFHKGAQAGDSSAQTNLGYMYDQGLGCTQSSALAVEWYRKAAGTGNAMGENNLADMYLRGQGVGQDDAAAFTWFQKAAAQGHTGARIKLGYLYSQGRGTTKDLEAAYSWITAAVVAGDPRGKDLLQSLERSLSSDQLARARRRAATLLQSGPQLSASMFAP